MIVRCTTILSQSGATRESSETLTRDKNYTVIGLSLNPGRPLSYRLCGDDGSLTLQRADQFQVVDAETPVTWTAMGMVGKYLDVGYPEMQRPGLLERYFDGDPEATALVRKVNETAFADNGMSLVEPETYGVLR